MPRTKHYRMPPEEEIDRLVARVPKPVGEEIRDIADKRGVSLNTIMVEAFELYIQREHRIR